MPKRSSGSSGVASGILRGLVGCSRGVLVSLARLLPRDLPCAGPFLWVFLLKGLFPKCSLDDLLALMMSRPKE